MKPPALFLGKNKLPNHDPRAIICKILGDNTELECTRATPGFFASVEFRREGYNDVPVRLVLTMGSGRVAISLEDVKSARNQILAQLERLGITEVDKKDQQPSVEALGNQPNAQVILLKP
ncbi:hypothetical protein IPJ72_03710 [Candidatus Peregrinibacteria bacterium]|nr:MAG: hypothetical protein IPJ72_03710 [Candidatus Peregrinibacteria bacterium]